MLICLKVSSVCRAAIGQQLGHSDPGQCVHISSPHTAPWLFPLSGHLRAPLYHITTSHHISTPPPPTLTVPRQRTSAQPLPSTTQQRCCRSWLHSFKSYKTILRAGVVLYGEWSHHTISPRQKILQCCHNCGMKLSAAHGNTWQMSIYIKCQFSYRNTQLSFILEFIYLH